LTGWPATAVVAVLLLATSVATQHHMGAYGAELGYDEASHYASGLMIHDYLLHGLGTSPVRFLATWHSHYPLVGIGHWGPLYYGIEAVWMLLAGPSRAAALALSAVVAAATGTLIYAVAARRTPAGGAGRARLRGLADRAGGQRRGDAGPADRAAVPVRRAGLRGLAARGLVGLGLRLRPAGRRRPAGEGQRRLPGVAAAVRRADRPALGLAAPLVVLAAGARGRRAGGTLVRRHLRPGRGRVPL
jgi:hypothetical protein